MQKKNLAGLLVFLFVLALAAVQHLLVHYQVAQVPEYLLAISRWGVVIITLLYAWKKKNLTTWIMVAMVLGIEIGLDFPEIAGHLNIVSKVFMKLVKTIIGPLLFATLVVGIAGHSNMKQVGRMGWKSLLYFEIVTTLALFIGLGAINLSEAGVGVAHKETPVTAMIAAHEMQVKVDEKKGTYQLIYHDKVLQQAPLPPKQNWEEVVLHIFPENIAKSVVDGQILQIVVFSILFGFGLLMVTGHYKNVMLDFCHGLSEVMFKFTGIVMYTAPVAVGAAIAYTVGHMGIQSLLPLATLLATLYLALIVFIGGVLLPIALVFRVPLRRFVQAVSEPAALAFATTSSEAALPKAMSAMERLGVPRKIVSFVMPMGYSFNLDGTTLYLALATIFVAQAQGMHLNFGTQLAIVFTLMLTSKGVAGVPRASLVILSGTVASFDMQDWPIYLILGIDELMDMARTAVNVIGNCLATVVIARWEGEFDPDRPQEPPAPESHHTTVQHG